MALAHVCPVPQLLPADATENDRQNTRATALRELLLLEPFGLSSAQQTALQELMAELCGASSSDQ